MDEARELAEWFHKLFGKNFYIEVQNNGLQIQQMCAEGAIDIANRLARRMESRSPAVRRMRLAELVRGLTDALREKVYTGAAVSPAMTWIDRRPPRPVHRATATRSGARATAGRGLPRRA